MIQLKEFLDLSKFEKKEKVGEGSFGDVFKVFEKSTEKTYAAKVFKKKLNNLSEDDILNLRREITIMTQLNHPSILSFIGYSPTNFKGKAKPVIISEYLGNGTLEDVIKLESKCCSPKNWSETKKLINIFGIASAMSYLHSLNIIHRDLKPGNVLEDDSFYPKLADFGFSKKKNIRIHKV